MGKEIHIQSPIILTKKKEVQIGNAVSISIRCCNSSPNALNIGIGSNANSSNQLEPGESMAFGPYRDGDIIADTEFRFAFEQEDSNNKAIVIVSVEGKDVC